MMGGNGMWWYAPPNCSMVWVAVVVVVVVVVLFFCPSEEWFTVEGRESEKCKGKCADFIARARSYDAIIVYISRGDAASYDGESRTMDDGWRLMVGLLSDEGAVEGVDVDGYIAVW